MKNALEWPIMDGFSFFKSQCKKFSILILFVSVSNYYLPLNSFGRSEYVVNNTNIQKQEKDNWDQTSENQTSPHDITFSKKCKQTADFFYKKM